MDLALILISLIFFLIILGFHFDRKMTLAGLIIISFYILVLYQNGQIDYKNPLDFSQGVVHYYEMTKLVGLYACLVSVILAFLLFLIIEQIYYQKNLLSIYFLTLVTTFLVYLTILFGLVPVLSFFTTSDLIEVLYYKNQFNNVTLKDFYVSQMTGDPISPSKELNGRASSSRHLEDGSKLDCADHWQAFKLGAQLSKSKLPEPMLKLIYNCGKFVSGKKDLECSITPPVIAEDYPPNYPEGKK